MARCFIKETKLSVKNYIMKSSGNMWFRYNYKHEGCIIYTCIIPFIEGCENKSCEVLQASYFLYTVLPYIIETTSLLWSNNSLTLKNT